MKRCMKCLVPLVCAAALQSTLIGRAYADINPRALEDIKAFAKKVEEGDRLFYQKKYAEAAAALAAAHELYKRADRRDDNASGFDITLKPQTFPALRYYGYHMGPYENVHEKVTGAIETNATILHSVAIDMWGDACILSDATQIPYSGGDDPTLEELTEEQLKGLAEPLYDRVRGFKLPVPDNEWHYVVHAGRHAQVIMEHLLEKYPQWRTTQINWIGQPTGDDVMADIKKKLAEAEPEYQKVVADLEKAEPEGVAEAIRERVDELNKAIAGVKRSGWINWVMARDLYITKDYLSRSRPFFASFYKEAGKTMPAGKLKPIENKIAELKSTVDKTAPRWRFPTDKPHNAAIEARARNGVKAKYPGSTILKTALDDTNWRIEKNAVGIPRYRALGVLVLAKIPGQKWPWLIFSSYEENYAGGGTYSSGTFAPPYSDVRIQTAK